MGVFVLGFALSIFRAGRLQLIENPKLNRLASKQTRNQVEIVGRRGSIFDRHGRELALSTNTISVFANPQLIKDHKLVTSLLSKALDIPDALVRSRLTNGSDKKFIWIARQLSPSQVEAFEKLDLKKIPGIGILPEFRREYPLGRTAAHALGLVSIDGEGLEGLEAKYNLTLSGQKQRLALERDALGRPLFSQRDQLRFELSRGQDLHLTIDSRLQHIVERHLLQTIEEFKARGGAVVVLDPHTGEVLALTSAPSFDPENPSSSSIDARRNRSITDPIEPGSVIKPLVVAQALESKFVKSSQKLPTYFGKRRVGRKVISDSTDKHAAANMTVSEILRTSSNTGMLAILDKMSFLPVDSLFKKLKFNSRIDFEIPGMSRGIYVTPRSKQVLEQATLSFGQGLAINPLHLTAAFSTLANGGYFIEPSIIRDSAESAPTRTRVFSESTTEEMRRMLERVVQEEGTGTLAQLEGFQVAGKTGTSQKVDFDNGGYKRGAYWSLFTGFVPSKNPRFIITVMIDEPEGAYYGGVVAAPVFSRIALEALRSPRPQLASESRPESTIQSKAKRKKTALDTTKKVRGLPDFRGLPLRDALELVASMNLNVSLESQGDFVASQTPEPGTDLKGTDRSVALSLR